MSQHLRKKHWQRIAALGFEQERSMASRKRYDMCIFQGAKHLEHF